jgi:hypothetical protein
MARLEEAINHLRRGYAEADPAGRSSAALLLGHALDDLVGRLPDGERRATLAAEGLRMLGQCADPAAVEAVRTRLIAVSSSRPSADVDRYERTEDSGDVPGGAADAIARRVAALSRAATPSMDTVGPLVTALTAALDLCLTEGPFAQAETELTRRLPTGDGAAELRTAMLAGGGTARALRWVARREDSLLPGVQDLLRRAEDELPQAVPTPLWLGACLPLFSVDLWLAIRGSDPEPARAAARLAGVLGDLLDRHPDLAQAIARTVSLGAAQHGMTADAAGIRQALRMMESLLPMLAGLSSLSLPGTPFGLDAFFGGAFEGMGRTRPDAVFVPSSRAHREPLPGPVPREGPDPVDTPTG